MPDSCKYDTREVAALMYIYVLNRHYFIRPMNMHCFGGSSEVSSADPSLSLPHQSHTVPVATRPCALRAVESSCCGGHGLSLVPLRMVNATPLSVVVAARPAGRNSH